MRGNNSKDSYLIDDQPLVKAGRVEDVLAGQQLDVLPTLKLHAADDALLLLAARHVGAHPPWHGNPRLCPRGNVARQGEGLDEAGERPPADHPHRIPKGPQLLGTRGIADR